MVWYLSKHVCGVPNAWQKGWIEAFPGLGGERKTAMCKEQCVPLRNAGERLGIRILVLDEELFLVLMRLRTKYPGLGSFHYSWAHSINLKLIPLYPGSGATSLKFFSSFLKSCSVLGLEDGHIPNYPPNEGKTQQRICLSWKNKVERVTCPVVGRMQIKYYDLFFCLVEPHLLNWTVQLDKSSLN